ncbi:hypothetical protein D3C80_1745230 [compost metagenome]
MGNGLVQAHAQGGRAAVADHGSGVTDQHEIDQGVDHLGDSAGIGGQGNNLLPAFHCHQLWHRQSFVAGMRAHRCFLGGGTVRKGEGRLLSFAGTTQCTEGR